MKFKNKTLKITCDGGAATGKSTGAKMIAKKSGEHFFYSNLREHLNLQDWTRMCLSAKGIAESPTTLFASRGPFNSPHTDVAKPAPTGHVISADSPPNACSCGYF